MSLTGRASRADSRRVQRPWLQAPPRSQTCLRGLISQLTACLAGQRNLGVCYERGYGVAQDFKLAAAWCMARQMRRALSTTATPASLSWRLPAA